MGIIPLCARQQNDLLANTATVRHMQTLSIRAVGPLLLHYVKIKIKFEVSVAAAVVADGARCSCTGRANMRAYTHLNHVHENKIRRKCTEFMESERD